LEKSKTRIYIIRSNYKGLAREVRSAYEALTGKGEEIRILEDFKG